MTVRVRRIVVALGLVVLLPILALVVLQLPPVQRALVRRALDQLRTSLDLDVSVQSVDVSLRRLAIVAEGVRVTASGHPDTPLFEASRLELDLARVVLTSRGRELAVERLALDDPIVTLVRNADGEWNLPRPASESPDTSPPQVTLRDLVVRGGSFRLIDHVTGHRVELGALTMASHDGAWRTTADAAVRGTDLRLDGTVSGDLSFDGDVVSFETLEVALAHSRITANGTFDLRSARLTVDSSFDIQGEDIARLTSTPGLRGKITGTLAADGTLDDPNATWTLDGKGLTEGTLPPVAAAGQGTVDAESIRLTSLTLDAAGGTARVTGVVGLGNVPTSLDMRLQGLRAHELVGAWTSEVPVATIVDGEASMEGPGLEWHGWDARMRLNLRAPSAPARDSALPLDGVVSARLAGGHWSLDGNVTVPETAAIVAELGGTLTSPAASSTVTGTVRADVDDLAALLARVAIPGADVAGQATLDLRVSGRLDAPRAAWSLDGQVASADLATTAVSAQGAADASRIHVSAITLTSGPNGVSGDATIGLSGRRPLTGTLRGSLPEVGRLFQDPAMLGWPLSASASFDAVLGGTLDAPVATGHLELTDLALAGQRVEQLSGTVAWRGNRVDIRDLSARSGPGRLTGQVAADLVRQTHDSALTLTTWPIHPVPSTGDAPARPLTAVLSGTVTASGPWLRPTGTADISASEVTWDGHSVAPLTVQARADGTRLDATFSASEWRLGGHGQMELDQRRRFELVLSANEATLAAFRPWLPEAAADTQGTTTATVTVTGLAADLPDSVTVAARVQSLALSKGDASVLLEEPAGLTGSSTAIRVEALRLRSGDLHFRADGEFGKTPSDTPLHLTVAGPLKALEPWLAAFAVAEAPTLDGTVDATVHLAGTTDAPRPSGALTITDAIGVYRDLPPVRLARLQASLDNGVLQLPETLIEWQDAQIIASARVPLRLLATHVPPAFEPWLGEAAGAATLSARAEALDTRLLEPLVGRDTLEGISGRLSAGLEVEATTPEWSGVTGALTLQEATFRLAGIPLAQARPTVVRLDAGHLRIKDVLFSGVNTDLAVDGDIDLTAAAPAFDLQMRGLSDLALLRPFVPEVVPGGRAEVNVHLLGTIDAPSLTGELILTDASLRLNEPRLAVELLNGTATFTGRQMTMPSLSGIANGAPVTMSASLALSENNDVAGQLELRATGLPLEYPEGMRIEADVNLAAAITNARVDVTGTVDVLQGIYRDPIALSTLSSGLLSSTEGDLLALESAVPLDVRFDVQIRTRDDVVVDNNYGRFSAGGAVRLLGSLDSPALSGRITLREGGEVYVGGLTYRIERGVVDFANPSRIEPILDVAAETRTRGQRVRVEASGTPDTLDVSLSAPDADTPPSQADLASLLVSGHALDDLSGLAAGEQALGLLSADLLGVIGRGVGLDAFRLDRELLIDDQLGSGEIDVAAETDPVARLTVAKRVGDHVELVYSQNLRDASEITWLVTWKPFRRTEVRLLQRDDRSTSYEFRREVVFGAPSTPRRSRPTPVRVRAVHLVAGDDAMRAALQQRLSLDAGSTFDFYRWQRDRDRLEGWLNERGYYEHRIVARRETADQDGRPVVDLRYEVTPGPRATLAVNGADLSSSELDRMRQAWQGSVFDGFLRDDLARLAREALLKRGHPMPSISVDITRAAGEVEKTATVTIDPGPEVPRDLLVDGLEGPLSSQFEAYLTRGLERLAWLDAAGFETAARTWLRNRGALDAAVTVLPATLANAIAVRRVRVDDATPYVLDSIATPGVPAIRVDAVRDQLGLTPGDPFDTTMVSRARRDVERWYAAQGFREASVTVDSTPDPAAHAVGLRVDVKEGPRAVIVDSRVEGARRTQRALLDRALALPEGTIATPEALMMARKRLYDTGVLSSVDVETTPAGPAVGTTDGTVQQPVVVTGTVREMPWLRLRFGLAVNDDVLQDDAFRATSSRRVTPGLSALLENRNLLGRALSGGVSARYERARRTGRAFLIWPSVFERDIRLQASSGITRSRLVPDLATSPLDVRTDATIGATQSLPGLRGLKLTYGYRYERSRTYNPNDADAFDITITAPRLTTTVFVDRRDDVTATTRGWLHASTVEVSRSWLGSDVEFVKYYAQQSAFRPFGRTVLAGRAQVGLGRGFSGQDLLGSERFFAGGAVSVRGYGESVIGELDPILGVARGDGLLVLNGEIRRPLWRWISGVGFVDGGGIFDRLADVGVGEVQWGTGGGVRIATPAGLVRVDVGIPLNRRPTDKAWRVYLGLGHAF